MLTSQNWLKEFYNFTWTPQEISDILTMLGIEVEAIHDQGSKFNGFITAKVLGRERHPNADKLSVCKVFTGSEECTVICGAPNVAPGQTVILATDGAIVPSNGLKIERRTVRGVESQGMICSETELGIGEDGSGIMVLPEGTPIGQPLAQFLKLNDVVYDISITPNRADCLSHFGIARELAAYGGSPLPLPTADLIEAPTPITDSVKVIIEDIEKCPRYAARVVKNVKITSSPEWLKNRLEAVGLRPRNIVVDVTNFVMYECGQPLHAFDLDTVAGNTIVVKTPRDGEKITTLDSKERTLDGEMLMICDAEKPVAIAGVMGGENSEISDATTNVLIESAYFAPSSIRRTSKKLAIQSDASYRFERGVDMGAVIYALDRAAQLIATLTGGEIQQGIIDVYPQPLEKKVITLRFQRAADMIGVEIQSSQMVEILRNLGFTFTHSDGNTLHVEVPSHRVDIFGEIDLVEEIARMYKYDYIPVDSALAISFGSENIPAELAPVSFKNSLRNYFVQQGFREIVTQNMIEPRAAQLFTENYVKIANPLGEELSAMRPSLVPSVLKTIERNIRLGTKDLQLFETGNIFYKTAKPEAQRISGYGEREELLFAITGEAHPMQWGAKPARVDFFDAKGILENLISVMRFKNLTFKRIEKDQNGAFSQNAVQILFGKRVVGFCGEIAPKFLKEFKVEQPVFVATLNLAELKNVPVAKQKYSVVSPFPAVRRDVAFV
ncbi:MAG TPA: phenylalanine--tRNA ligase subunit beta, partial [Patescibacteria group bacterium]|nr:phenylalanine--tRNA ligase subunit beta [Patescibacteria group bacterium]